MNIKRYLGSFMLLLSAIIVNFAPTSTLGVGVEDMPESIKNLR